MMIFDTTYSIDTKFEKQLSVGMKTLWVVQNYRILILILRMQNASYLGLPQNAITQQLVELRVLKLVGISRAPTGKWLYGQN